MTFALVNGLSLERLLEPDEITEDLYGQALMIFFAFAMILSWFLSDAAAIAVSLSRGANIMRRRGAPRKARAGLDRDRSRL